MIDLISYRVRIGLFACKRHKVQSKSGSMTNNYDHPSTHISHLLTQIHGTSHSHLWLLYYIFMTYFILLSMSLTLSLQTKSLPHSLTFSPSMIRFSSTILHPVVLAYLKIFCAMISSFVAKSTFLSYMAGKFRFRSRIHQLCCFFLLWLCFHIQPCRCHWRQGRFFI